MISGEYFFLDVGQGTANAILLKGKRAVLLDAGPAFSGTTLKLLKRYAETIECVVLSHSHQDHFAGWEAIAQEFQQNIKAIYTLCDRPIPKKKRVDITMKLVNERKLPRPIRAEVASLDSPQKIWQDTESDLCIELMYPDMLANETARVAGDQNKTSAIACLHCGSSRILFPGDSTVSAWRDIHSHATNQNDFPMPIEVLAMPHHGGLLGGNEEDTRWLFDEVLKVKTAIISVGSINNHGHPKPEVVSQLRSCGVRIMCTQITKRVMAISKICDLVCCPRSILVHHYQF